MRRFTNLQRYSVIVPVHVANRLAFMSRDVAGRLRRELNAVAEQVTDGGESTGALRLPPERVQLYIEVEGVRLHYQVDPVNRSVIAVSIEDAF